MTRPTPLDQIDAGHPLLGASGSRWKVEPDDSRARFTAATLWGRVPVTGDIGAAAGELEWLGTKGRGHLRISTAQLDSGIRLRDHHLRSSAFFDVERHPEIVYDAVEIAVEDGEARVSGELMIRGQRHGLTCMAKVRSLDRGRIALEANVAFDLDELGMSRGLLRIVSARVVARVNVVLCRVDR
jgi:polyisoprenoid-binding protein YceI